MSATVIPMPVARSLFSHPAGVNLVPDPELVGAAAYALASLAGEDWTRMTPTTLEEYRMFALLAATCAGSPNGLRLAAYSVGKTSEHGFTDMPPVVRRGVVDRLMGAIRGAALRVHGVSNPQAHADLLTLMDRDTDVRAADIEKGGW